MILFIMTFVVASAAAAGGLQVELVYDTAQIFTCPCPLDGCTNEDSEGGKLVPAECQVAEPETEALSDLDTEFAITQDPQFYCQKFGRSHSICKYQKDRASSQCGQVYKIGLSNGDADDILDIHNKMRSKVASGRESRGRPGPMPGAANMVEM